MTAAGAGTYLFTSIGSGSSSLTEAQEESLCNELSKEFEPMRKDFKKYSNTIETVVKLVAVKSNGDTKTVYGWLDSGLFVKARKAAYLMSGGSYPFVADIKINGNKVEITKRYGDGVTEESVLKEMPYRYRFQITQYGKEGYLKLTKELNKKVEAKLGVPVDSEYTLNIEGKKYEIFNWTDKRNVKEKGLSKDLIKK